MNLLANKKNIQKNILIIIFFLGTTFVLLLESPNNPWNNGEAYTDSSVFKYIAMAISKGQMPYRDTFDHKGPILYLLNYLGQMISFYRGTWVIEYVAIFITFFAMYKIARLLCGRVYSILAVLLCTIPLFSYYDGGNLVEEYAMPFIAISLYIFMDYFLNQRITKIRLIICGISFACVLLLRPNMIATWIVFCITVLVQCIRCNKLKQVGGFISYFLVGVGIVGLPIMFWFLFTDTMGPFINDYFLFNFLYASNDVTIVNIWDTWLFFHDNILLLCFGVLLFVKFNREIRIPYISYLLLTVLFMSISGKVYGHYGMILIPAMVFPCALFCKELGMMSRGNSYAGVCLSIIISLIFIVPIWRTTLVDVGKKYENREESHYSQELDMVVKAICETTQESDTITVYGNWDIVYVLTQRLSASRYSYQFPVGNIHPQIMEEYIEDLEFEHPKWIVVQKGRYDERIEEFINRNQYLRVYEDEEELQCMIYRHSSVNWE